MLIESAEIKDSWTILEGLKSNNGGQGVFRTNFSLSLNFPRKI